MDGIRIGEGDDVTSNPHRLVLDPAAQAFIDDAASRPPAEEISVEVHRAAFAASHRDDPGGPPVAERWTTIDTPGNGPLHIRIIEPLNITRPAGVLLYLHGGGWVSGNASTHDRIVRELAVRSGAAVIFPEYALSPDVRYPTALEQVCATAEWLRTDAAELGLDPARVAIAGDSEGATLAIAAILSGLRRNSFHFRSLVALTPVTDADFDTPSYLTFAQGYGLRRDVMQWHWDQYAPDPRDRSLGTVCPFRADSSDLARFPPSLIVTAEADVVRDEGEAFAARLRAAGSASTAVRYEGTIHGFAVLPALKDSAAARAAIAQAGSVLSAALRRPGVSG